MEKLDRFRDFDIEYPRAGEPQTTKNELQKKVKATPFEEKAYAILRLLAEEGPLNKYQIGGRIPLWGRTVLLHATDECYNLQLIGVEREEKDARGRGPSQYYDLALRGIGFLLCRLPGGFVDSPTRGRRQSVMLFSKLASKLSDSMLFELWPEIKQAGLEDLAFDRMKFSFHSKGLHEPTTRAEEAARFHGPTTEKEREESNNFRVWTTFWAGGRFTYDSESDRVGLDEKWLNPIRASEKLRMAALLGNECILAGHPMSDYEVHLKTLKATLEFLGLKKEFIRDIKKRTPIITHACEIVELMKDLGMYPLEPKGSSV